MPPLPYNAGTPTLREVSSVAVRPLAAIDRGAPVARRVVDQILVGIRDGRFPIGCTLPSEQEMATLCEVSRPSVREALSALQFAGYVESRRGAATVVVAADPPPVAGPSARTSADPLASLEARLVLEPEVVGLAARDPDLRALDAAAALVGGMGVAIDDDVLHPESDLRVHAAVLAICRNPILREQAVRRLPPAVSPFWQPARDRAWSDGALPRLWAGHHRRIFDAVAAGDAVLAAAASREHLRSVAANLLASGSLSPSGRRRLRDLLERHGGDAAAPPHGVP